MKKLMCVLCALTLSACATTGAVNDKSFEQKYSENADAVKTCVENTIAAVLGVSFKGLEVFENLCEKRN